MVAGSNRGWVLRRTPEGRMAADDFQLRVDAIPEPKAGEVLVRTRLLSVDPGNRAYLKGPTYRPQVHPGELMHGFAIGEVMFSNDARFSPGDIVEGWIGWQEYAAIPAADIVARDGERSLTDLISVFGMTGLTAYYGLLEVGRLKAGETVLVSAAAGAVGSIAGQIAKIAGCRVVGVTGGSEKCAWIKDDLGFDAAVDYKAGDLVGGLRAACPEGVDIYLDNVAGDVLDGALRVMNFGGRIVCCGMVSVYDSNLPQSGSRLIPGMLMARRLQMLGFIVLDHLRTRLEAEARLARWMAEGRLRSVVDLEEGLERAPAALVDLLAGGNRGKKAVRVA